MSTTKTNKRKTITAPPLVNPAFARGFLKAHTRHKRQNAPSRLRARQRCCVSRWRG